MVARLNHGVTGHEHTFTVANKSTDGDTLGQSHILDGLLGDTRTFLYLEFCYIGIGKGEAFHIGYVGIEHHLIDVAGGNHLLVDDGTDVQTFCHADIVNVFYFCHGLDDSQSFGGQASQDVRFRIAGQSHESIGILDSFFQ